jgi:broad specificity phosphatase PhoE
MIHLIRHAPKAWDNGRGPPADWSSAGASHDPPLAPEGQRKATLLGERLVAQEDEPAIVLCSPFLRCRETAELMAGQLVSEQQPMVCPLLREYLGNWAGRESEIDLTLGTVHSLGCADLVVESWAEFANRTDNAAAYLAFLLDNFAGGHSIWAVTHGTVMRRVYRRLQRMGYPVAMHFQD